MPKPSIQEQLSSRTGDRTEQSNQRVAAQCLDEPAFLDQVAESLAGGPATLVGDCAEVMTKVAEEQPELVVPYADPLLSLLDHKTTRVRWEATHAVALMAQLIPDRIVPRLPQLKNAITNDTSTIVRDYAIETLTNLARAGKPEARIAYPVLLEALEVWNGKHAARALNGLAAIAKQLPDLSEELGQVADRYETHDRGSIRKAAKALKKAVGSGR